MISKYVAHAQDKHDVKQELDKLNYPFILITKRGVPDKLLHPDEWEKRRKQLAYFNRTLVPLFRDLSGYSYKEAKDYLYTEFALISERDGRCEVESMADMGMDRLSEYINDVRDFIITEFGVMPDDHTHFGKTKFLNK